MTDREKLLIWCRKYCNNLSLEDEEDFKLVLDSMETIISNAGVTHESLSDMSQSFGKETALSVRDLLSPYKKVKFL